MRLTIDDEFAGRSEEPNAKRSKLRRTTAAIAEGIVNARAYNDPVPILVAVTTALASTAMVVELILDTTSAVVSPSTSSRALSELLNAHGGSRAKSAVMFLTETCRMESDKPSSS